MPETSPQHNPNSYDTLFGRIEEKLDNIALDITEIKANSKELSKRVTVLEGFRYYVTGLVAVASAAVTFVLNKYYK